MEECVNMHSLVHRLACTLTGNLVTSFTAGLAVYAYECIYPKAMCETEKPKRF